MDVQNFEMLVGGIDPKFDGELSANIHLKQPSTIIGFGVIRISVRILADLKKALPQGQLLLTGKPLDKLKNIKGDKKPVFSHSVLSSPGMERRRSNSSIVSQFAGSLSAIFLAREFR